MFSAHIHQTIDVDDVLGPDTLEWRIFINCVREGKLRRQVRDLLNKPLYDLALKSGLSNPTKVVSAFTFIKYINIYQSN